MGTHFDRGNILVDLKRYREAAQEFRKELAETPDSAKAHVCLASALNSMSDFAAAEESAKKAIEFAPEWNFGYYILSIATWNLGKRRLAERTIREAIRLDATDYSWAHLARIHLYHERYQEAAEAARHCMELNPTSNEGAVLMAKALAGAGSSNLSQAKELLNVSLAECPVDTAVLATLGELHYESADYGSAIQYFRDARSIDPIRHQGSQQSVLYDLRTMRPFCWVDPFFAMISRLFRKNYLLLVSVLSTVGYIIWLLSSHTSAFTIDTGLLCYLILVNAVVLTVPYWVLILVTSGTIVNRNRGKSILPWIGRSVLGVIIAIAAVYFSNVAAKQVATQADFGFWLMSITVLSVGLLQANAQQSRLQAIGLNSLLIAVTIVGAMVAKSAPVAGLGLWFIIMGMSYLIAWNSARTELQVNSNSAPAP